VNKGQSYRSNGYPEYKKVGQAVMLVVALMMSGTTSRGALSRFELSCRTSVICGHGAATFETLVDVSHTSLLQFPPDGSSRTPVRLFFLDRFVLIAFLFLSIPFLLYGCASLVDR
jgi:hypothetical protein